VPPWAVDLGAATLGLESKGFGARSRTIRVDQALERLGKQAGI
jgi:hypothetical protein